MNDVSPWFILSDSPGEVGDPEIWIDEATLERYVYEDSTRGVTADRPVNSLIGATITFGETHSPAPRSVYQIRSRRYGPHNGGQPYYVARWPD
jgi:hypothetical protein